MKPAAGEWKKGERWEAEEMPSPAALRPPPAASGMAPWSSTAGPNVNGTTGFETVNRRRDRTLPRPLPLRRPQAAAMSCCAGLGSPPPREIVVEYSSSGGEGDDYTDEFIKLANAIEERFPEFVVFGNPDELRPREGAFEITTGDSILFSKLKVERLPELHEIVQAIANLPPATCTLS